MYDYDSCSSGSDDFEYTNDGEIQLILGPMFSGKSTELLRRIRRYTVAKRKCAVIKYNKDSRYHDKNMSTHDLYEITIPLKFQIFNST